MTTEAPTATAPAAPAATTTDLLNTSSAPPPAAPKFMPVGFPVAPPAFNEAAAVAARAEIETLKGDKEFYAAMKAERERGLTGPASQKWAALHKSGFPSPTNIASQNDADAQASARTEQEWNSFFAGLRAMWSVTPEQEAEMRAGVIREDIRNLALQQRDLMVKDKTFYRRLLDGDMAAKEKWSRVIAAIALRPVPAAYFTEGARR